MSYRDNLKQRIKELEMEIENKKDRKENLIKELQELMRLEFEEEMREEGAKPTLLKG